MKLFSTFLKLAMIAVLMVFFTGCEKDELNEQLFEAEAKIKAPTAAAEAAGNNLSFPVIWAEDIPKTLRTPPANLGEEVEYLLEGTWWYVWGPEPIDPASTIYSCAPSPSDEFLCIDQTEPGTDGGLYKGWVQKDPLNFWEAYNENAAGLVEVDFVDWGDNLESIDWTIQSRVRTELVLYEVMPEPVLQYPMRHVDGWGITEVHGLQTNLNGEIYEPTIEEDPTFGTQATVYSTHTRMTIQKLNVNREELADDDLVWDAMNAQWVDNDEDEETLLINEPLFSNALYEAADGPGFFNAEVNVKGKIMYGYTWDMKKMNEGTGDYRITYSFDADVPGSLGLNTFFTENTEIIVPLEEEEEISVAAEEADRGGVGMLDTTNNLTYMDIRIIGKTTGGGGGNSGGGNGGGGSSGGSGGNSGGGNGNGGGK